MNTSIRLSASQKGQAPILTVVGILVLVVITAGVYFVGKQSSPQPENKSSVSENQKPSTPSAPTAKDEFSNWKTYTGEGYSYNYPNSWTVTVNSNTKDQKVSLKEFASNLQKQIPYGVSSQRESLIAGKASLIQEAAIHPTGKQMIAFILIDNSSVLSIYGRNINYSDPSVSLPESVILEFNQILSTFKFIDQNQTSETANWKTCKNTLLEIEFRYPPNWYIDGCSGAVVVISSSVIAPAPIDGPRGDISISSGRSRSVKTYEEAVQGSRNLIKPETLKTSSITISNKQGTQISGFLNPSPMGEGFYKDTLFPSKDVVLGVSLIKESQEKIYDQILSTFKFD